MGLKYVSVWLQKLSHQKTSECQVRLEAFTYEEDDNEYLPVY